jgi:hypothetical protein
MAAPKTRIQEQVYVRKCNCARARILPPRATVVQDGLTTEVVILRTVLVPTCSRCLRPFTLSTKTPTQLAKDKVASLAGKPDSAEKIETVVHGVMGRCYSLQSARST